MILGIISCIIGAYAFFVSTIFGFAILIAAENLSPIGMIICSGLVIAAGVTGIVYGAKKRKEPLRTSMILHIISVLFALFQNAAHGKSEWMILLTVFNVIAFAIRVFQIGFYDRLNDKHE